MLHDLPTQREGSVAGVGAQAVEERVDEGLAAAGGGRSDEHAHELGPLGAWWLAPDRERGVADHGGRDVGEGCRHRWSAEVGADVGRAHGGDTRVREVLEHTPELVRYLEAAVEACRRRRGRSAWRIGSGRCTRVGSAPAHMAAIRPAAMNSAAPPLLRANMVTIASPRVSSGVRFTRASSAPLGAVLADSWQTWNRARQDGFCRIRRVRCLADRKGDNRV